MTPVVSKNGYFEFSESERAFHLQMRLPNTEPRTITLKRTLLMKGGLNELKSCVMIQVIALTILNQNSVEKTTPIISSAEITPIVMPYHDFNDPECPLIIRELISMIEPLNALPDIVTTAWPNPTSVSLSSTSSIDVETQEKLLEWLLFFYQHLNREDFITDLFALDSFTPEVVESFIDLYASRFSTLEARIGYLRQSVTARHRAFPGLEKIISLENLSGTKSARIRFLPTVSQLIAQPPLINAKRLRELFQQAKRT